MSSYLEEIIGKENTTAFIAELKNAFQTTEKTNEKSIVDLTIQGGEEPSGITLETFNVDGDQDYTEAINDMLANAAFIKPVLEEMALLETVKNIDIDEITISIITPSVKTGYVHLIKVPGLTQVLNEKIFS